MSSLGALWLKSPVVMTQLLYAVKVKHILLQKQLRVQKALGGQVCELIKEFCLGREPVRCPHCMPLVLRTHTNLLIRIALRIPAARALRDERTAP